MLLEATKRALVVLLLVGCGPSASSPPPASSPPAKSGESEGMPMPPELVADVERSCVIGRQLYVLDRAAALGTDVLMANVPDAQSRGVAGYLPLREGDASGRPVDSYLVSFFTAEDPPKIAYEVRIAPNQKPEFLAYAPPKQATPGFYLLALSRQRAISALPVSEQPINPVVLPGDVDGKPGVLVYLLAGTKKPDVAVFGKHFRALVALDGKSVSSLVPLTNTTLEVPTRDPNGKPVEALVVSHFVTAYPLETHVFTSLLWKTPIYVGTSRGVFRVDGDDITFLGEKGPRAASE
jgi:hypothetical protein